MSWTEERVNLLEKLWKEGRTASEIAKEMGGVTRNAVIGKAHRMGLSGRPSPIKKVDTTKKVAAKLKVVPSDKEAASTVTAKKQNSVQNNKTQDSQAVAAKKEAVKVSPSSQKKQTSGTTNVFSLKEKMCKWPIGDPRSPDFHFCGGRAEDGLPYCAEHAAMAYQTTTRRKPLNIDDLASQV